MFAPLPDDLPTRLTDYLPGRIVFVPDDEWPAELAGPFTSTGVRTRIPRYALEVRTRSDDIDPARVRWLAQGSTIRPLRTRPPHLTAHLGQLWLVAGHTALAAHLASGTDPIPVKLVTPLEGDGSPETSEADDRDRAAGATT